MKYDRPVWQIMHLCADAMPDVFRYDDVRAWFAEHYPEVNEATIRAHLIGLTEGGRAKHVQFEKRSPVFRRVARGEYAAIARSSRGEDPDAPAPAGPSASQVKMSGNGAHLPPSGPSADGTSVPRQQPSARAMRTTSAAVTESVAVADDEDPETAVPDVILLGSVGDRVNVPAPAKEVYREVSFQLNRLDAELSGSSWFVLSAEHGLVAPNEWISPDSRTLADMDPDYRVVWAAWVVSRLQSLVGQVDGMLVRVEAPAAFTGPLFAALQEAGAVVSSGSVARIVPPSTEVPAPASAVTTAAERWSGHEARSDDETASVHVMEPAALIGAHLRNRAAAVSVRQAATLPEAPGVYGWLVDPIGARELNRCLRLPVRTGLVFVGQVGGSSWQSLADPVVNLRDHVLRIQLHGRARASTFRMTLATVLSDFLGLDDLEDPRLTDWMLEHLSITTWVIEDPGRLREIEQQVILDLDPPLNVDHLPASEYRARLSQMRSALA